MIKKNVNKILSASFIFSLFGVSSYAGEFKSDNTPPVISYTTEQIGDRERLRVTLTATDESGIREFIDHKGNTIIGDTTTVEFDRRGDSTFSAIDNAGNRSEVTIDLSWINPYTKNNEWRKRYGSSYWTTSNLREWLNSDSLNVSYTSNPPSKDNIGKDAYDEEPGFLKSFTVQEKEAIAVTEHRVWISDIDEASKKGGDGQLYHLDTYSESFMSNFENVAHSYKKYRYKSELDKVFLLSPFEAYWYLTIRDYSYNIPLTSKAKTKHNINSDYFEWWLGGSARYGEYDTAFKALKNDLPAIVNNPNYKNGVVPAIHIKPEYVFSDNRVAKDLNIGDEVIFGEYLSLPIKWKVINITESGYPLLLSSNILDLKRLDSPGDNSRIYSDFINFKDADVSTLNDVEYRTITGSNDITIPSVNILNQDELNKRQSSSFTLNLEVVDSESGVDYVVLPDGRKVTSPVIDYTFDKNGNYIFKTADNAGNVNKYLININNINKEAEVNIELSNNAWSNEGVIIDIDSSANVKQIIDSTTVSNKYTYYTSVFPNYSSYAGKKFKISGHIEFLEIDSSLMGKNLNMKIDAVYKTKKSGPYSEIIDGDYPNIYSKQFTCTNEKIKTYFEAEYAIPSNFAYDLKFRLGVSGVSNLEENILFTAKVSDLKFECLDTDDFAITHIELPNGEIVNGSNYSYKIISDGIHEMTYRVHDNRGMVTEKTITVKVDRTKPVLNLEYDYDKFDFLSNKSLVVNVSGSDALSGFKRIRLPDGTYTSSSNTTYTITDYGTYVFECEDVAGNITRETIVVEDMSAFEDAERLVEIAEQTRNSQDISIARESVNNLYESSKKDELQDRLNAITNISDLTIDKKSTTANVDIYIKCENMLSLSLNNNSITFEDFNGTEDLEQNGALELSINSSLPYEINVYLEEEIQNNDKTEVMDKRILNLKESNDIDYKEFTDIKTKLTLVPHGDAGNDKLHIFDFKLNGGIAHKADVYKTSIKFEVRQK